MVGLRKSNETLIYGKFDLVDSTNEQLFAFTRRLGNEMLLVVLNFSDSPAVLITTIPFSNSTILISNIEHPQIDHSFKPYAAVIYKIYNK
jgi:glycosidase